MIEVTETTACEISPAPVSIPHNLPVHVADNKSRWFLSGISTEDTFVFINPTRFAKATRTVADGWTKEDADSFTAYFNGHDYATIE